jgi:hypothetical protein
VVIRERSLVRVSSAPLAGRSGLSGCLSWAKVE